MTDLSKYNRINKNNFMHEIKLPNFSDKEERKDNKHIDSVKFFSIFKAFDNNADNVLDKNEMQNLFDEIIGFAAKNDSDKQVLDPFEALDFRDYQIDKIKNLENSDEITKNLKKMGYNDIYDFINFVAIASKLQSITYSAYTLPKEINPEDFTIENLRKKYPKPYFEIITDNINSNIKITIKDDAKNKLTIIKNKSSIYISHNTSNYDDFLDANYVDGKLYYSRSSINNNCETFFNLTEPIHNLINNLAPPSDLKQLADNMADKIINKEIPDNVVKEDLKNYLEFINKYNFNLLSDDYQNRYDRTLISDLTQIAYKFEYVKDFIKKIFDDIFNDCNKHKIYIDDLKDKFEKELKFLDSASKPRQEFYFDEIMNDLIRRRPIYENNNKPLNGKIDDVYRQGNTGDCWLIAAIRALENNEKGKKILDRTLELQNNGDIKVNLQGVKKSYIVKKEEIEAREELSVGDNDVRAIEIAVEKYLYEERGVNINYGVFYQIDGKSLDGGWPSIAFKLLAKDASFSCSDSLNEQYLKNFNNKNYIFTVSSSKKNYVMNNKSSELFGDHAYTVVSYQNNNVFIQNPHDPQKTIPVPKDEFKAFFEELTWVKLE